MVRLSTKGRLIVRGMTGQYNDHGYELAHHAVIARASSKPGGNPVVSTIGNMLTVLDMHTMLGIFTAAE